MSADRADRVLDAAYRCFGRHGVRKTTMEEIAVEAGMSRPAVYQYVRNKDDAFARLAARGYRDALERARGAAGEPGTLAQRLDRILAVKLGLADPGSAVPGGLVGESARIAGELKRQFLTELVDLLTATIIGAAADADLALTPAHAREIAELALALARGLDADLDPDRRRDRLRNGVALLVAGVAAAAPQR